MSMYTQIYTIEVLYQPFITTVEHYSTTAAEHVKPLLFSSSADDIRHIWATEQREYSKHAYAKRRINIHPQKVQLPAQNSKYN